MIFTCMSLYFLFFINLYFRLCICNNFHLHVDAHHFSLDVFLLFNFLNLSFFKHCGQQAARDVARTRRGSGSGSGSNSGTKRNVHDPSRGTSSRISNPALGLVPSAKIGKSENPLGTVSDEVTQKDLVEALNSLLNRVGLSTNIEEKRLLERVIELESSNRRLLTTANDEKKARIEAETSLKDAQSTHMCSICETEEVSHVMVPCGHMLCGTCESKVGSKCFYCRLTIQKKIRFYLPGHSN